MSEPPLSEFLRRLEANFWNLLAKRYPLTRWRWDETIPDLLLFPQWTRGAFQMRPISYCSNRSIPTD